MKKIADTLGVPWHRVRDWAYGSKPGTSDILLLADTLGLSMRWLLGGDGDRSPCRRKSNPGARGRHRRDAAGVAGRRRGRACARAARRHGRI